MKKLAYLLLIVILLFSACSRQQPTGAEPGDLSTESAAPKITPDEQILTPPTAETTPEPSSEPPLPTETPEPTDEPEPESQHYTYERTAKIHETMPEYRFVASGEGVFVLGLEIYDENNVSILSASFEPESYPVYPEMMDTMGLHVTDVNFDGYKDVIILNCFYGAHGNTWYDCWLWDQDESAFTKSDSFAQICNPAIDADRQCIYSAGGSGAGYQTWLIYKYLNGEFVVTNSLDFEAFNDGETGAYLGFKVREEALKNGKMEVVNEETLPESVTFGDTRYNDDTLWQLNHPHWYYVGGHDADIWLE